MINKTAMIADVLKDTKHTVHITKSGLHKIECVEPLKDYVYHFGRLRGLDIRFELSMPAVADIDLVQALVASANDLSIKSYKGINRTHDAFYSPDQSVVKWGQFYKDKRFNSWPDTI